MLAWAWSVCKNPKALGPPVQRILMPAFLVLSLAAWMLVQSVPVLSTRLGSPLWHEASKILQLPMADRISVNPSNSLQNGLRLLTSIAVFFLAWQLGSQRKRAATAIDIVAGLAFACSIYGLLMHLGGFNLVLWWERTSYTDSVTATFINRNHFATFAGLGLLCALAPLWKAFISDMLKAGPEKVTLRLTEFLEQQWPRLLAVTTTTLALVLTQSRGGILATLISAIILVTLLSLHHHGSVARIRNAMAGSLLGLLLLVLAFGSSTIARIEQWTLEQESRDELFVLTLKAIGDSPWLGYGGGSFSDMFRLYRDQSLNQNLVWEHTHNSYLEFALDYGIVALAALITIYIWLVCQFLLGLGRRQRDRIYPAIGLAATTLIAIHALVDFSIQLPGVALPFALLLGIAYAQSWPSRFKNRYLNTDDFSWQKNKSLHPGDSRNRRSTP